MTLTIIRASKVVMVDEALFPYRGALYCHMFSRDLDALHDMASRIGVRRWFQCPPKANWSHYDLSPSRRREAVLAGAREVDRYEAVLVAARERDLPLDKFRRMEQNVAACRRQRA